VNTEAVTYTQVLETLEALTRLPDEQRKQVARAIVNRLEMALAGMRHPELRKQRLRAAREKASRYPRLGTRELARVLHVNRKTAQRWRDEEKGVSRPRPPSAVKG
jgi:DNA-binding transcriptional regulator YiaG